tara:strand:+ start:143 stop:544 length:402 start_codon:yes stop_codon:yes gene_type:complete
MAYKQSNNPISRKSSPIKNTWTEEGMDPYGDSDPFDTSDGQRSASTFIKSHPDYDPTPQDKSRHYPEGKNPVNRKTSSPLNEIKPENRGKFTKWAKARGMTAAQAASKVMGDTGEYTSEVVKMANFAKNAQSW